MTRVAHWPRLLPVIAAVAAFAVAAPVTVAHAQGSTADAQSIDSEIQQITNEANSQLGIAVAAAARCDLQALAAARIRLGELLRRARQLLASTARRAENMTPDGYGGGLEAAGRAAGLVRFVETAYTNARALRPACPGGQGSEWEQIGSDPRKSGAAPGLSSDRFSQWLDEIKDLDRRHAEAARRCDKEEMARILAEMDGILRVMASVAWSPGYRAAADDQGPWGDSVRAVRSIYSYAQSIRRNAAARKPECPEPVEELIEQPGSGNVMPDEPAPDQPSGGPPAPPGDSESPKQGSTVPPPPESGSRASNTMDGAPRQESRQNRSNDTKAPWPSKADSSDLKAKNSETLVEPMDAQPTELRVCDQANPSEECAGQQPPQRKPKPRERRRPR